MRAYPAVILYNPEAQASESLSFSTIPKRKRVNLFRVTLV